MFRHRPFGVFWGSILALLLSGGGCARLDYVKVPTPTQYQSWSDENQKAADGMKGVRYYLPRPFLHLKTSVPVAQRVALVSFVAEENGTGYRLVLSPEAPSWVRRIAPERLSDAQALSTLASLRSTNRAGAGSNQSTGGGGDSGAAASGATNAPSGRETPAQTLSGSVGYINDTDPVTRLSPLMDVVYLPDFEEQFVIRPRTGFAGQADIETKLRNGWAAETFKQSTDNSQLIPYVIRQVQSASDAAAKITTTWLPTATLGLPPGTTLSVADWLKNLGRGTNTAGAQQSTGGQVETPKTARDILGSVLLFKIAEVRIAQPGVYPILKPREIQYWLKKSNPVLGVDPEEAFEQYLQASGLPWIRPDMAFIPCPPFTMIGFNVTTDVYLLPATEKVALQAGSYDSTQPPLDSGPEIAKLKKALLTAAGLEPHKSAPGLANLTEQLIKISLGKATPFVGMTVIELVPLSGKNFDPTKPDLYTQWVEQAWKPKGGRTIKAEMAATSATTRLFLSVDGSPNTLASDLPE